MSMKSIKIGRHIIGSEHPCYIIAEIGVNHEGDFRKAKEMIHAAKEAGASAVKLQIVLADTLYTQKDRTSNEFYHLFKNAELSTDEYVELKAFADGLEIDCFASFNDRHGVDVSNEFNAPAFKIASTQLANMPLVDYVARQGKPIILSTGMSNAAQIDEAIDTILAYHDQLIVLHCISNYPTLPEQVNLKAMDYLKKYGFPVGFSDHTIGHIATVAAVTKGATVIEKHFTFDKTRPSFDHRLSCEPAEFRQLVEAVRMAEKMFGSGVKRLNDFERAAAENYTVKLVAAKDIEEGELITDQLISASRNKEGIPGALWKHLLNKTARRNIEIGESFRWSDLDA